MDAQSDGAGNPMDNPNGVAVDSAGNVYVAGRISDNLLRIAAFPPQACRDGIISVSETCDDGGTTSGDGCNASRQIETGFDCFGVPSVCAVVPSLSSIGIAMLCGLMGLVSWRRLRDEARR